MNAPGGEPVARTGVSRIAGRGLFATRRLPAGVEVELDAGALNHSCEPNVGWTATGALVTMREVADGEELTTDYALDLDDPSFVMTCHCETYRCRQLVEGNDWQIPQLQKRYAGFWGPTVRHLVDESAR